MITVVVDTESGEVSGTYGGGEYVDVSFNGQSPMEVINVFDYAKGRPVIRYTPTAVEETLKEWLVENYPEIVIDDTSHRWNSDNE